MPPPRSKHLQDADGEPTGLVCANCGCQHFLVERTEHLAGGRIRRHRYCRNCGRRKTTIEYAPGADEEL